MTAGAMLASASRERRSARHCILHLQHVHSEPADQQHLVNGDGACKTTYELCNGVGPFREQQKLAGLDATSSHSVAIGRGRVLRTSQRLVDAAGLSAVWMC